MSAVKARVLRHTGRSNGADAHKHRAQRVNPSTGVPCVAREYLLFREGRTRGHEPPALSP